MNDMRGCVYTLPLNTCGALAIALASVADLLPNLQLNHDRLCIYGVHLYSQGSPPNPPTSPQKVLTQ